MKEYEYKLNNQKTHYDLENTSLQLENVKLMNSAISDLNARSELIESVMHHIGVEIMDTGAACRTYNILMSDRRKVAAALLTS